MASKEDDSQDKHPDAVVLPHLPSGKQQTKDGPPSEDLEDTATSDNKNVRILRSRKKSGKYRLTRARKQLVDLLADKGDGSMATKSEIRRAAHKVRGEFEIIEKIIRNLKEIIALGEDGDETIDVDATIDILDNEIDEITDTVDQAIKAADDHLQQRLAMGEAESVTLSFRSDEDDDRNSIMSISSSLAAQRRREAEESKQRLLDLEKEQQQEEEVLQKQMAAFQLTKRRTEEARQVAVLNQTRATAAEEDEKILTNTGPMNEKEVRSNRQNSSYQPIDMIHKYPLEVEHFQQRIAPIRLKGVELPMFSGENKADYDPWKAAFMSVVDEAVISTKEKMLRLQNSLTGKALKMVKDLGYTINAYERAKAKLEKKYGGEKRLRITHLTTLRGWPKLRPQNLEDMEEFLALLDRILVSLQDSGPGGEAKGQNLNLSAKEKLSVKDVQAYKYWLFERAQEDTFESLVQWLEMRVQIMDETIDERRDDKIDDRRRNRGYNGTDKRKPRGCVVKTCREDHPPWVCQTFKRLTVPERKELISQSGRCFRCLAIGHQSKDCSNSRRCGINGCPSNKHSRYLHTHTPRQPDDTSIQQDQSRMPENPTSDQDDSTPSTRQESIRERTHAANQADHVSLMVLPAFITNGRKKLKVNVMLDPCSTGSYVTESASQELQLQGQTQSLTISGTGGSEIKKQSRRVELSVMSLNERFSTTVQANVLDNITGETPALQWSELKEKWPYLKSIPFDNVSRRRRIDVLIGSDHPVFHRIHREVHGLNDYDPIARLTNLGWVCFGPTLASGFRHKSRTHNTRTYHSDIASQAQVEQTTDDTIRRFWDLDSLGIREDCGQQALTSDEQAAIGQLERTQTLKDGRYEVGIPWREDEPKFNNNYEMAFSRLKNLEKSLLKKDPKVSKAYQRIIDDYIEKEYIRRVPEKKGQLLLPHFPVVREEKSSTKVRIVFDAAAKHNGKSLNDAILPGPKLQREVVDVLIRFRRAPVALSADISEMFLQIRLREEDRAYHRFLWRNFQTTREPDIYEFLRLPFGNTSSPFCAQRVLQTHAQAHATEYPEAAKTVDCSMYVDDVLDSCETIQEAQTLQRELSELLLKAGFNLRKWSSNEPSVLDGVPTQNRLTSLEIQDGNPTSHKILGVLWKADEDVFAFKVEMPNIDENLTKRKVLSAIATLFDPLQFLAPFTVRAKILMQEIWRAGIEWDDVLPSLLKVKWQQWSSELQELSCFTIPRCLRRPNPEEIHLHVFSDASENAYATAAYLVCHYQTEDARTTSCLIAAKSRVSPLKAMTIPRLELMGAILSTRLAKNILQVLSITKTTFWTDSTNVLYWVRNQSRNFKPFVANRVGEIQKTTNPDQWRHIPGKLNPADLPTRGLSAMELAKSTFWIEGPEFLKANESTWPDKLPKQVFDKPEQCESKATRTHITENHAEGDFIDPTTFSSLQRLVRTTAWVRRFLTNCRLQKEHRGSSMTLSSNEISQAEVVWLRRTQTEAFPNGEKHPTLAQLNPQRDSDGLLRANGRLRYADDLPYDTKYPILLPKDHPITKLIVTDGHERLGHSTGTEHLLTELRAKYWILKGRRTVKKVVETCRECRRRFRAKPVGQMMAPLPEARVKLPLKAFDRVGIDYGGPFLTKQGRRKAKAKRYLCLFTCLNTRAVHLEMAYSLDTDSFVNAFIRMTSRRGTPSFVISDNGTNFVGAEREMRELIEQFDQNKIVNRTTRQHKIQWKFNPPSSPHFGGVFEAMVKSSKKAMRAILKDADVTDEELQTAIAGAEGLLNSRPITYVSSDPNDLTPLTPNHFIVGQLGGQYAPEAFDVNEASNPRERWRRVQQLLGQFWSRWRREFLPSLNKRGKWFHPQRNMKEGDVVLVVEPKAKRGEWPLGRITEALPGKDGLVRVVKLTIGKKQYMRPVHRLCPLECNDE